MSSEEFDGLVESVLQNAEKGSYSLYDYDRLSNYYHYFIKEGLITRTADEFDNKLIKGLNKAAKRKELDEKVFVNMSHFEVSNPEMQPVRDHILALHRKIKEEQIGEENKVLIEMIQKEDTSDLDQLFEGNKHKNDLMKYVDGKDLFQALQKTKNKTLSHFTKLVSKRFRGEMLKYMYPDDYDCLKDLEEAIEKYIAKNENLHTLRKFNWKELLVVIKEATAKAKE